MYYLFISFPLDDISLSQNSATYKLCFVWLIKVVLRYTSRIHEGLIVPNFDMKSQEKAKTYSVVGNIIYKILSNFYNHVFLTRTN